MTSQGGVNTAARGTKSRRRESSFPRPSSYSCSRSLLPTRSASFRATWTRRVPPFPVSHLHFQIFLNLVRRCKRALLLIVKGRDRSRRFCQSGSSYLRLISIFLCKIRRP